MTPRERVLTALCHKAPDRVPFFYRDVPEVEERLRRDLGLADRDALLTFLEVDFRWVEPAYVGPPLEDPDRGVRRDIWGVEYRYVRFSETAGYWEAATRPLAGCTDPAALADYPWPKLEWFDFSTLPAQTEAYDAYAIMTAPGYSSPGILQCPIQALVGEEKSLADMLVRPDFFDALVERVLAFQLPFIERMLAAAEGRIDFFRLGDDFGTQRGLLVGPDLWRARIAPALKAMADTAKTYGAYYYHHSCGAVRELIPDMIAIGVDILDPLQVKAVGMDPATLKREFGEQLCFSGGVDQQELLPRGTPEDVRAGVHRLLDAMARDGGFFIGPTHNFQDDIPTANILALYDAAREWRG